jgi:CRISPR-associated endonuclease Csn1
MGQEETGPYILGLDVGVASVGWARIACADDLNPRMLLGAGSHLFEPGTEGTMADIERGKDEARNVQRRTARQTRRQTWRRARRKRKLLKSLIDHRLLPDPRGLDMDCGGDLRRPLDIDAYIKRIDADLTIRWMALRKATGEGGHADQQRLCYLLREAAAVGPVEAVECGRALYHLAQRRGFQSNRRAEAKQSDEDSGKVQQAIGELAEKMRLFAEGGGTPTLGSYLASLDPDEQRLRGRWTARSMYTDEFDAIWKAQARRHGLDEEARAEIYHAIFHQRPLKNQSNLIGRCSLLPDERRCPVAHRLFQRFRVLQALNHLEIAEPGAPPRVPTPDERERLLTRLTTDGDTTFAQARTLLKLKKGATFNLERGDEKRIVGHRTDAKLRTVCGDRFQDLTDTDKDRMVEDLRSFRQPEALIRRANARWGLPADDAVRFASLHLEEGYAPLSLAALKRLVPRMAEGLPYATARKDEFPESFRSVEPLDSLPPVLDALDELRNPAVARALTEVRKLVNECVRLHGKPAAIRVELARDVKNPRKVRERITRDNRDRERRRATMAERVVAETGMARVTRSDIERAMLAEECGWICPYTGRQIGWESLFGPHPQFDIEHIWPRSRSLDDSLMNKTLCYHEENRARKRGNTPREAYGGDPERLEEIVARIRLWKTDPFVKAAKIGRFEAEAIDEGFKGRHLSDTRFIARAAADYLGLLFGGRVEAGVEDAPGTRRVDVCTGGLTAWLRTGWGIDRLLGESADKNRADHRHHAVDAIVVALTDPRAVQTLARAAAEADRHGKARAFESIDEPWEGFREEVERVIKGVVVSHRQSRKVSGPLHDASIYSHPTGPLGRHFIRKELHKLTVSEIRDGKIVDARALKAIRDKLAELGKPNPSQPELTKIFTDPANAPVVRGHAGKAVRLRKVRVEANAGRRIGSDDQGTDRWVQPKNNHHTVIVEVADDKGKVRWEDRPVQLLDAYARAAAGQPVVNRAVGERERFVFSLAPNDCLEMKDPNGGDALVVYRMLSISAGDNGFQLHRDGRNRDAAFKDGAYLRASGDKLRRLNARKVRVTYLGEVINVGG